jgi:hypothetical protein
MAQQEFQGSADAQKMAGWIANLMMQRGFSYGLNSTIEMGQDELVEYFTSQSAGASQETLVEQIEAAIAANAALLDRRETPEGVFYTVRKRKLMDFFKPAPVVPAPEPVVKRASAAPSAASPAPAARSDKTPPVLKPERAEKPPAQKAPSAPRELAVTQRYQLAILQALHQLGGSAATAAVVELVPKVMEVPADHMETYARGPAGKSEQPKYVKYVQSARGALIEQGELDGTQRGVWAITPGGVKRLKEAGLIAS